MTLKISFRKLVIEELKQRAWLFVLSLLALLAAIPVNCAIRMESNLKYMRLVDGVTVDRKAFLRWLSEFLTFGGRNLVFVVILLAVLCGISGFTFLHSREKTDFYQSFPIPRKEKFLIQYVSGFIIFFVPFFIGQTAAYLLPLIRGYRVSQMAVKFLASSAYHTLFFLLIYHIVILAFVLTGKMLGGILGTGVLLVFSGAVRESMVQLGKIFFQTYTSEYSYIETTNILTSKFTPMRQYWEFGVNAMDGKPVGGTVLLVVLVTLLLFALDWWTYVVRPSEGAGKILAFPKLEPVVKVSVSVVGGAVIGGIVYTVEEIGTAIYVLVFIVAAILIYFTVEFIYHTDLQLIFKKKGSFAVMLALVGCVLAGYGFDVFGYDRYLPEKEEIREIGVTFPEMDMSFGHDYDSYNEYVQVVGKTEKAKEEIYELARTGREGLDMSGSEDMSVTEVIVRYKLENGATKLRRYYMDREVVVDSIVRICEDEKEREQLYGLQEIDTDKIVEMTVESADGKTRELYLSEEQKEKFIETYKEELMGMTVRDMNGSRYIFALSIDQMFTKESGSETWKETISSSHYIFDTMQKTLKLLKEYGVEIKTEIVPEEILEIVISKDDGQEAGASKEIDLSDKKAVDAVLKNITNHPGIIENRTEDGIYAEILFRNGVQQTYMFYKGLAPEI